METEDRSDLPQELLSQLSIKKPSGAVLALIESYGEPISINEIVIGVYKKTGEVYRRPGVLNTLTMLTKSKQINRVSRGMYQAIK